MASIESTLEADGLALNVTRVGDAFCMSPSGKSDETVTVLDSAFIDDVSIAIIAPSAEQLVARIPVMLDRLVNVFADFGLNVNWKPGMTECMIRLRWPRSGVVFGELCCDGGPQIAVSGTSPVVHLQIVNRYKHLGSFIQENESLDADAIHKSRAALCATAQLRTESLGAMLAVHGSSFR